MASSTTKPGGDGQGHEGEVVQAVAEQVHDPEGADEGDRHRHAGNEGGPEVPQEDEDHQDDQGARDHRVQFHVLQRTADGRGCGPRSTEILMLRGMDGRQLRQQIRGPGPPSR